jgi:hypothetical protein
MASDSSRESHTITLAVNLCQSEEGKGYLVLTQSNIGISDVARFNTQKIGTKLFNAFLRPTNE